MTKPTIASVRISSLEVLSGPGDAFDTISCVEKGEVLRVLEKHGNWVKVSFSKVGWVESRHLNEVCEKTPFD